MTRGILLVAALFAACSGKKSDEAKEKATESGSGAAAVSAEDQALAEKWTVLHGEYATAMEGAGVDCVKATAAVRQVNAKNADLIAKGKPRIAELRAAAASAGWFDANVKPKLGAALDRMAPVLDSCRGNAELSAALAEGAFERKSR